ncbi:MAG: long-chain fatty acid--CoA ligase [Deltaproteobacteria bacterium]|nr:long-chain fatty acid--CoA ligase [Deltaproteobacteria bacterium]
MSPQWWTSVKSSIQRLLQRIKGRVQRGGTAGECYPWEVSYPKGISWRLEIAPAPLQTLLLESIRAYPDHRAVSFLGKRFTYKKIGELAARAAKGFQILGVQQGVNVGLCLPNSPYYVVCYYGVLQAGGTPLKTLEANLEANQRPSKAKRCSIWPTWKKSEKLRKSSKVLDF